jgi:hypothetical protein
VTLISGHGGGFSSVGHPGDIYLVMYLINLFIFAVLEFELRAYTLRHSTCPFL